MSESQATGERADYARRLHAAIELVWRLGMGHGERFMLPQADLDAMRARLIEALKVTQEAKIVDAPADRTAQHVTDDTRLRALLEHLRMREALTRYRAARWPKPASTSLVKQQLPANRLADMQSAIRDALATPTPLPDDIRAHLATAFDQLCQGVAMDLLTPGPRKGGRVDVVAKSLTESAVRYVLWCKSGKLHDQAPQSTVAEAFSVDVSSVRRWLAAWGDRPAPPLAEDWADLAGDLMRADAARYRRLKGSAEST